MMLIGCRFPLTPSLEPASPNADASLLYGTQNSTVSREHCKENPVTPLSPGNRETDRNPTSDPDVDFAEWSLKRP